MKFTKTVLTEKFEVVKDNTKKGPNMINWEKNCFGSGKYGEGKAFTHIPTNLFILFKINSTKNHLIKRGRKSIASKKFNINRVLKVIPRKRLTLPLVSQGGQP